VINVRVIDQWSGTVVRVGGQTGEAKRQKSEVRRRIALVRRTVDFAIGLNDVFAVG
jgi:hypothetical protein